MALAKVSPAGWFASVWMPWEDMKINCDHFTERNKLLQTSRIALCIILSTADVTCTHIGPRFSPFWPHADEANLD